MNKFVKFWSIKRFSNNHVIGSIVLITLVVIPVVCALILSESMIKAMSEKYIYLSSGHLTVFTDDNIYFSENSDIKYSDKICSGYAMIYSQDKNTTVFIKGVEDNYFNIDRLKNISFKQEELENSNLNGISISEYTAELLDLNIGDKVAMMIVPDTAGKSMRPVIVRVAKIFTTGYEAIDSNLAFIDYEYAKTLFTGDSSKSIELILNNEGRIDSVRNSIISNYNVSSWMSSNYSVFSNFVTSKQVIMVILLVVIVIAGFYTASAARLLNEDYMKEIAILKMLGANNFQIFRSSLYTSLMSTLIGVIIGLIFGLLISFNFSPILRLLSKSDFAGMRYYLFNFDIVINWSSIFACFIVLIIISIISVSMVLRRTKKITPIQLFQFN